MRKSILALLCVMAMIMPAHAYAAGNLQVSQPKVEGNVIKYTISAENEDSVRVISALYAAGKLTSVNTGTGSQSFYAPANKSCTVKVFALDKVTGDITDTQVFGLTSSQNPYKETAIIFLPDNNLETAAGYIHDKVGGDMAEIVPNMVLDPTEYDMVFVGYKNTNGSLSDEAQKIFDTYDFGKATIVPFCAGEVNGTDRYISTLEPKALVHDAMNISGAGEQSIREWLWEIGF